MTHLLDRVAAFLDGELDHAERDRVMVHLATCAACRADVAAHRALKSRLAGMAEPEPSAALLAALHRMSEPGEPLAAAPSGPTRGATRPPTVGVSRRPPTRDDRPRSRARRRARALASTALLAVGATLVTAFAVGGPAADTPPLTPDFDSYMVEHARTSRDVPFAELPADVVDVSFRNGTGR